MDGWPVRHGLVKNHNSGQSLRYRGVHRENVSSEVAIARDCMIARNLRDALSSDARGSRMRSIEGVGTPVLDFSAKTGETA